MFDDKPLVLCRGFFVKIAKYNFKLEHVQDESLKEIIKIAVRSSNEHEAIQMLNKLGETHCFVIHRGVTYETVALFEREMDKL